MFPFYLSYYIKSTYQKIRRIKIQNNSSVTCFCGCEMWSIIQGDKHKYEVLKKISGPEKDEVNNLE